MNVQLTTKKEAIFTATLSLLQEYGLQGTPMSQIAKAAEISVGSIYHYFESKDELIMELFNYCKAKLTASLFADLDREASYEIQFKTIWKRFIAFHTKHTVYFRFLEQFYSSPYNAVMREQQENSTEEVAGLHHFLKRGVACGTLKELEIELLCAAFTGVAISFVKSSIYGKVAFSNQQIDQMVEIVWKSIKAEGI